MEGPGAAKQQASAVEKNSNTIVSSSRSAYGGISHGSFHNRKSEIRSQSGSHGHQRKEFPSGSDVHQSPSNSGAAMTGKRRVHQQVCNFFGYYLLILLS